MSPREVGSSFQNYLATRQRVVQLSDLALEPVNFDGVKGPLGTLDVYGTSRLRRQLMLNEAITGTPVVAIQSAEVPGDRVWFVPWLSFVQSSGGARILSLNLRQTVAGAPVDQLIKVNSTSTSAIPETIDRPFYIGSNQRLSVTVSGVATTLALNFLRVEVTRGEYVSWPGR